MIDFCFQGWVRGANISQVINTQTMQTVNVEKIEPQIIAEKLNSGEWTISLEDYLHNCHDSEIEIFDFEEKST